MAFRQVIECHKEIGRRTGNLNSCEVGLCRCLSDPNSVSARLPVAVQQIFKVVPIQRYLITERRLTHRPLQTFEQSLSCGDGIEILLYLYVDLIVCPPHPTALSGLSTNSPIENRPVIYEFGRANYILA